MANNMKDRIKNPFNITKADDFSDQQIYDNWVDMPQNSLTRLFKPSSPMPMLIYGGKGSGKTHLMRYFSSQLHQLRHADNIVKGIIDDNYLGIYLRCGGLNASRFNGKGQSDEAWSAVFAYYMELWLAQLILKNVKDLFATEATFEKCNRDIAEAILSLFDNLEFDRPTCLDDLISTLSLLQKSADIAINNCAISQKLDIRILVTSPNLVFGIPRILTEHLSYLQKVQFLFLIDELENLLEPQQKYIFTLVRERKNPCSFKFGSRLYGIKSFKTYNAGEELKEGSEYEVLFLDEQLRKNEKYYTTFTRDLCVCRLIQAGYLYGEENIENYRKKLDGFFENYEKDTFALKETGFVIEKYRGNERPYFSTLRNKLNQGCEAGVANGITRQKEIDNIILRLSNPEYPLLEKMNIFLLYKAWSDNYPNLLYAASEIATQARDFINDPRKKSKYRQAYDHFKADMVAQLLRECDRKPYYIGFETFIDMSNGLPRNLLIFLKHIYKWSSFKGEGPFIQGAISIQSQQLGVKEAADWFFEDAQVTGKDGVIIQDSISRLATLFRAIRYSDKPSECSISSFSIDKAKVSNKALDIIQLAEKWSLLIRITSGQKDRNTERVDVKYQLNSMIAPKWDLPIYRRGTIALSPAEVNSIFDPKFTNEFEKFMKNRTDRMNAPFFGKKKKSLKALKAESQAPPLFDE